MDFEAAGEPGVRRLDVLACTEHASPAQCVDDQRRADVPAIGVDRDGAALASAAVDFGGLERRVAALSPQVGAQGLVVEGGEREGQGPAGGSPWGVGDQPVEGLADGVRQAEVLEPSGRCGAGRGLALPDLVAVHEQDSRAARSQLARHRQAGERGAADEDVDRAGQGRPLCAAFGGPDRHGGRLYFG